MSIRKVSIAAIVGVCGVMAGAATVDDLSQSNGAAVERSFTFKGELEPGLIVDLHLRGPKAGSDAIALTGTAVYEGSRPFSFTLETTWTYVASEVKEWQFADRDGLHVAVSDAGRIDVYQFDHQPGGGMVGTMTPTNGGEVALSMQGDFSDVAEEIGVASQNAKVAQALSAWTLGYWKGGASDPEIAAADDPQEPEPETCWEKMRKACGKRQCSFGNNEFVTVICVKSYSESQNGDCSFECYSYGECCGDSGQSTGG